MKLNPEHYPWYILAAVVLLTLIFWPRDAEASKYPPIRSVTNNYYTENHYHQDEGVSDSDLDSDVSMLMAADAIHCTTSTRKKQAGVGAGYRSGKNGYAVGGCQTFVTESGVPVMLGVKAAGASGRSPAYSVGFNITF